MVFFSNSEYWFARGFSAFFGYGKLDVFEMLKLCDKVCVAGILIDFVRGFSTAHADYPSLDNLRVNFDGYSDEGETLEDSITRILGADFLRVLYDIGVLEEVSKND